MRITLTTDQGVIVAELFGDKAPLTVCNFLTYVQEKFYDNTCFHRIIAQFVVEAGGMDRASCGTAEKTTHDAIKLETQAKLHNDQWTLAMARKNAPNSATSQFYINTVDNCILDAPSFSTCPGKTISPDGYAVFGKVVEGSDVVKKLEGFGSKTPAPFIVTARLA